MRLSIVLLLSASLAAAQTTTHKKYPIGGSAPNGARLQVAGDLDARLAKWRRTPMPFNRAKLTANEAAMVEKLVLASQYIDDIYWRQSDPDGLTLYKQLEHSTNPRDQKIVRLLKIQGSRWDLLDRESPFVGTDPMPPGRAYYPAGLPREQI